MDDKDKLLDRIIALEKNIANNKATKEAVLQEGKQAAAKEKEVEEAFKIIRAQFEEARQAANELRNKNISLRHSIDNDTYELNELKRELKRKQDKEKIDAEYLAQVEDFKAKCLDAPWRKENRTDGFGALPHQIDGAIHLAVAGQALLGDKRGLGKSLTALITSDLRESRRIIAIVPSDTMNNFIREIKLWTPHRSPIKLGKMDKGQRDFLISVLPNIPEYVLVLNYEAWRRDSKLIKDLANLRADTLILDEAHRAKTLKSNSAQGIHKLRFSPVECVHCGAHDDFKTFVMYEEAECQTCGYRDKIWLFSSFDTIIPMTGTPIINRPQELFPQLKLIAPDIFPNENAFLRDFCYKDPYTNHWTWQHGGEKRVVEKLKHRIIARDRQSAGVIIPPAQEILHIITKDEMREGYPQQYKAYEQVRNYAQVVLNPDSKVTMSMPEYITVLMRLRQVNAWPAAIELKIRDDDGNVIETHKLDVHESIKLDRAEELIREIIDEGERVVLFSEFKAPLEVLQKRLGSRVAVYNGDTSDYLKRQIQLDFDPKTVQPNPRFDAVLCNYRAAGEGLNFNAASQMIILDERWAPGYMSQAKGRIDRLGQTRETTIHTIRVEDTVDTWMAQLIKEKAEIIDGFESQTKAYQDTYDALRKGNL